MSAQAVVGKKWTFECGASTNTFFRASPALNFRYLSPRFKWSDYELSEEEEKHSDDFKNTRLMLEFIYGPPIKTLAMGFNAQSRILKTKRVTLELVGGVKFFFLQGTDFAAVPFLKSGRGLWYMNLGIQTQVNLGMIAPFAEIGGDFIFTLGTELNIHYVYRKPKKRYKLHSTKVEK